MPVKLKILLFLLFFSFMPTYAQEEKTLSKLSTKKIIGTWAETKIIGYLDNDSIDSLESNDTIYFNKNNTYTWTNQAKKETGKWTIESYLTNEKKYEELLDLEDMNGTSNGAIAIYKLTKDTLILRTYRMVGKSSDNNSIDLYFIKVK